MNFEIPSSSPVLPQRRASSERDDVTPPPLGTSKNQDFYSSTARNLLNR